MEYSYRTNGVCSREIHFHLDGNTVTGIGFIGGCNGNLKAVSKLCDGMTVEEIEEKLAGNTCGDKGTSCADQLARAVREAYEASREIAAADGKKQEGDGKGLWKRKSTTH